MDVKQYRELIVRTTLKEFQLWSKEAEDLVVGTSLHESGGLRYIHQVGGPALGLIQMEPATYRDLWENFITPRQGLVEQMEKEFGIYAGITPEMLISNLALGAIMCRIHYLRSPGGIPMALADQAKYWKKYYNTYLGKGTVEEYIKHYNMWNKE